MESQSGGSRGVFKECVPNSISKGTALLFLLDYPRRVKNKMPGVIKVGSYVNEDG